MKVKKNINKHQLLIEIILLSIIILLAFFLRSYMYLHGDFNFFLDQARDMSLVKEIVVNHDIPLIGARSGLGGIFHGPLWLYMVSIPFFLSGGDPYWTLVPLFLLISMGIVIAGYLVGRRLYDAFTGLLIAFFLAVNPSLLQANAVTTNAQVMPLIFLVYIFSIILFLRGKANYFILAVIAIGIGIHFESAFSIFLIPLTLIILLYQKKFPSLKILFISIGGFLLSVSTFIIFELRHQFLMTNAAMRLLHGEVKPLKGYEQFSDIVFRMQDRFQHLIQYFFYILFEKNQVAQIMIVVVLVFALTRILTKYKKTTKKDIHKSEYLFFLVLPLLYFGIYIFYPMPLWDHYLLPLVISSIFLFVLSIRMLVGGMYGKLLIGILLIIISLPVVGFLQQKYFTGVYQPTIDGSYLNQKKVVEKIFSDSQGKPFGYFQYSTGVLTYNMDYLIWWENKKYHIALTNKKMPTTYLILFPAPVGDESAHEFWKKNVIRTKGEVMERWKMDGGIIIEKLKIPQGEDEADPNYYQNLLFR